MIWNICILLAFVTVQISSFDMNDMSTQMIFTELELLKSKYENLETKVDFLNQKGNSHGDHSSLPLKSIFDVRIDRYSAACETTAMPTNCEEATACTHQSGIYKLLLPGLNNKSILAYCDDRTDGGDWLIIQMRSDGSETFHRTWPEYVNGFGNVDGEHWLGLENIYALTNFQGPQELYVHLEDFQGNITYAKYDRFQIGNEKEVFKLKSLGLYRGTAGDSFTEYNLGMPFSTHDRDNAGNCSRDKNGAGWWFMACAKLNLNGKYYYRGTYTGKPNGIYSLTWHGVNYSQRHVKMMIRRQKK